MLRLSPEVPDALREEAGRMDGRVGHTDDKHLPRPCTRRRASSVFIQRVAIGCQQCAVLASRVPQLGTHTRPTQTTADALTLYECPYHTAPRWCVSAGRPS